MLTCKIPSVIASHKYSYDKSVSFAHPTLYDTGLIEIHCLTEGCPLAILVELPKVVIDENAVFSGLAPNGGKIYAYTYDYKINEELFT